ncbi:MAG: rhomboid family intramembrane serine protease [Ardenticatenaceae bacterium]|nr:rhomboid family intramembrane serine protease [Ardenticatenaceae bacterium]
MQEEKTSNNLWLQLKRPLTIIGSFIVLLWIIEIIDQLLFRQSLDNFGVHPRSLIGLWGILWAPFLHRGFQHLIANTGPILVLGTIIMISRSVRDFFITSLIVILVGGFGTWLIGPADSVHLGASGLIFGYFGFLLISAYFVRSCRSVAIALVVLLLYSGIIWGVLPQGNGISWQTHLFGFVGGWIAAYALNQ